MGVNMYAQGYVGITVPTVDSTELWVEVKAPLSPQGLTPSCIIPFLAYRNNYIATRDIIISLVESPTKIDDTYCKIVFSLYCKEGYDKGDTATMLLLLGSRTVLDNPIELVSIYDPDV